MAFCIRLSILVVLCLVLGCTGSKPCDTKCCPCEGGEGGKCSRGEVADVLVSAGCASCHNERDKNKARPRVNPSCRCGEGCTCCPKCDETCRPCPAKCNANCPGCHKKTAWLVPETITGEIDIRLGVLFLVTESTAYELNFGSRPDLIKAAFSRDGQWLSIYGHVIESGAAFEVKDFDNYHDGCYDSNWAAC